MLTLSSIKMDLHYDEAANILQMTAGEHGVDSQKYKLCYKLV